MKTNSSIALFLAVAIGSALVANMLTAHIMISSYDPGNIRHISLQSPMLKMEDLLNCDGLDPARPTINCPLGKDTPPEYHHAMISSYSNVMHTKLFHRCANLPLPLSPNNTIRCWPRLIILPSHATSGNELFQYLMDRVFTNMDISMSQYYEVPTRKDPLYSISNNPDELWNIVNATASNYMFSGVWGTLNTTASIPFMGRPVIFKSHTSQSTNDTRRSEVARPLIDSEKKGLLHGVVRMARNPGDQILRNSFRWLSKKCYQNGDECFFKNAHIVCDDLGELTNPIAQCICNSIKSG